MDDKKLGLSNTYPICIIRPSDKDPLVVIRSKDMAINSLRQDLEACNVPHLRFITHEIIGKGTWIASAKKKVLVERLCKAHAEDPSLSAIIAQLIKVKKREVKMVKNLFTPEIKHLCDRLAIEIGRGVLRYLKRSQVEEIQ